MRCSLCNSKAFLSSMPDGHLLTYASLRMHSASHSRIACGSRSRGESESSWQKVGKDQPKGTMVPLENPPFGGISIPPGRPHSAGASPPFVAVGDISPALRGHLPINDQGGRKSPPWNPAKGERLLRLIFHDAIFFNGRPMVAPTQRGRLPCPHPAAPYFFAKK